jgi:hypothetical protein
MIKKNSLGKKTKRMPGFIAGLIACLFITSINIYAANGLIENDLFRKDSSANPVYSQGGGIFKFGNTYYWYGVKYNGAVTYYNNPTSKNSDTSFNAVTCYSSTDFVTWTFVNNILTASTSGLAGTTWLGRGGVAYCPSSGKYVWMSQIYQDNGGVITQGELYCTCSTPGGNFAYNNVEYPVTGIANSTTGDQTVFTDTDGQSYLCCSSSSGRANIYICTLRASDYCDVESATRIYSGSGREGNCMFKYNGRYYVCASDLHGWNASYCYVIDSASLFGPYGSEYIMSGTANTYCHVSQTGFFYTVSGTSGSFVLFAGDRWSDFAGNGLGYNVWCPISFNETTPVFNDCTKWNLDAAAGAWSIADGNNYVANPDFEADRITVSQPIGWMCTGTGNRNVSDKHYSGNFAWQQTGTGAYTATIYQTITGLPNGTYTLKAWEKSSGGQSQSYLYAKNYGGSQINYNTNTAVSSWTQVTVSSAISITSGQCEIGLYSNASANQWVTVDEFSLIRTSGTDLTPVPTAAPTSPPAVIKGDVNNNGTVDIVDALLIAQYYVGLNPSGFVSANADVNCSGAIDIVDALLVAQYYVGLTTSFPC